jgi:hypothetical protein
VEGEEQGELHPWAAVPAFSAVSTDHGRRARRTIKVALVPAWIEFDGAAQVAQLCRTVAKKGRKTVEVVYLITSGRNADPAALAAWVRGHWETDRMNDFAGSLPYAYGAPSWAICMRSPPSAGAALPVTDKP